MKVMLVFPPQSQPFLPHPALPLLKGSLQKEGIEAIQKDYNLEAYDYFLSGNFLEESDFSENLALMVERGKGYLRKGKDYFENSEYYESINFLEKGLLYISNRCKGTQWSLKNYSLSLYSTAIWADISGAIEDRKSNLFIDFFQEKLKEIEEIKPDLLGISVSWTSQIIPAFTLASLVKSHFPSIHISMGGSMITHLGDYICRKKEMFTSVDSFFVFDGENGIVSLAKELKGGYLERVPGFIYLKEGSIFFNKPYIPQDLNLLPPADFSDLFLEKYFSPQVYLPLYASRGCYWARCAFCSHHFSGTDFRRRSEDSIFNEMNNLNEKYGCKNFYFVDDSLPPSVIKNLALKIYKEGRPYRWAGELRFEDNMDPAYFDILYKGGCRLLLFGLESYSQNILNLMNKGIKKELVLPVIKAAGEAGIITWLFFLLGFPGEERREAEETLGFILENRKFIDMMACGPFILTRNSPVHRNPEKFNIKKIYYSPSLDLQLDYKFIPEKGLQRYEADELLKKFLSKKETEKFLKSFVSEPHLLFFRKSGF